MYTGSTYNVDSMPLPRFDITDGYLVGNDSIVLLGMTGERSLVGTTPIVINPSSIVIVDTTEVHGDYAHIDERYDMTKGYEITLVPGELRITPAHFEITLTAKSDSCIYGETGSVTGIMGLDTTIYGVHYHVTNVFAQATAVNVGEWPVNITGTPRVWDCPCVC